MKTKSAYIYILPISILLISFYMVPIVISIIVSFTDYKGYGNATMIGFENYKNLLKDGFFITAVKNTFFYAIITVPIQTILAMILAIIVHKKSKTFLGKTLKTVLFIPVISSTVLISVVWRILLNGDLSPLNQFVAIFNLSPKWLSTEMVKYTIIIISIWKNVGYFMIIYLASLVQIPTTYYEAAKIDGVNAIDEFRYITFPLLKPTTILVVFLSSIWSIQIFDLIYMLTGGGPANASVSIVMRIYESAFKEYNIGYAMSLANVLLFITATIAILQRKLLKRESSKV